MSVAEASPAEELAARPTQLPLFEGVRMTEHRLNFAGNVLLSDPDVVKQMHLKTDEVALVVRARVVKRGHAKIDDKEGNTVGGVSSTTIYITSVSAYDEE
jgi:hypothetical protein